MDAIKKKMQAMKVEKDNAIEKAEEKEAAQREAQARGNKAAEEVQGLEKRKTILETELTNAQEALIKANSDLETKEKKFAATEKDLFDMGRKIQGIEEKFETTETKLKTTTTNLTQVLHVGDESERMRKVLKDRNATDEEKMKSLEAQLKDINAIAEESDRKYDEVSRKLAMVEADLDMAEDRAQSGESKILELEEELKVVGNNLRSLEVAEEKAKQREADYKRQIGSLSAKLKQGEARAEFAQRTVQKLQKEVDRIDNELVLQNEIYKSITTELDNTYSEMTGY
jgi:tropomyosin-1